MSWLLNYLYSFAYPNLYIKCGFCLSFVLKSQFTAGQCDKCKEQQIKEEYQKLVEHAEPNQQ